MNIFIYFLSKKCSQINVDDKFPQCRSPIFFYANVSPASQIERALNYIPTSNAQHGADGIA
jgi:hypothetical protein